MLDKNGKPPDTMILTVHDVRGYVFFEIVSGDDELISESDFCAILDYWDLITVYLGQGSDELTCHNITGNTKYDLNGNNVLGYHEMLYTFNVANGMDSWQAAQIDCSMCMDDASLYYE